MTLTSQKGLDLIRDIAENRDEWRTFIMEIRRGAAEAVRWRLFGHISRRDPCIPANEAMQFYCVENNKRPRGRPITTLPVTLNNDVKHVPGEKLTLTSQKGLDLVRDIAENRDEWRTFIMEIRRGAAEAVRSDDPTSEWL
ncbi:hypothetical protein ElyMa_001916100 [Elysia marginata]|uniref:Uncharacterized protein n=1 Tax=Elysia marginata TaxID=1093978 RepID=A0AAV4ETX0_9GAST|nr:hypothetical protein ElyMa_001916100 [Elysia marginata]